MRQRSDILDRFYGQAGLLEGGNRTFTTCTGTFDFHVDFLHTELHRLFSTLLGGHLARERRAFSASLEATRPGSRPAQGITLGVRNRYGRVVECCLNMSDTTRDIAFLLTFFRRCFGHIT